MELVGHVGVVEEAVHVDVGLVVVEEGAHLEHVYAVAELDVDVEVAHGEGCEVVARHLVEELVGVDGVVLIGYGEDEVAVFLCAEGCVESQGVHGVCYGHASFPDAAHLKSS